MDPFGTGGLRERVLAAWAASPARFREDANTEEDYALGGYRDRVVVELAQNAADAAVRAGVPGRLLLRMRDGVLIAANNGAPLDAAGVQALSTLRASAKLPEPTFGDQPAGDSEQRAGDTVGRFGVGFAAVVAVTDEPAIASRIDGQVTGVMWSAARTRELVAARPELTAELARRAGHVPVLRLPFAAPAEIRQWFPDAGFDTAVRLPLRDADVIALVRGQLEEVGPALMLALPALARIDIDLDGAVRTIAATHGPGTTTINGATWRTVEAHGELPADLLADRPTEERARPYWQLRWATPVPEDAAGRPGGLPGDVAAVVHAPTPSAEPLGLPALLIASFPLAPDRRHVAEGPLTDFLIERAADEYANLLRGLPATPRLLDLVPGPVAAGALDARLRRAITARLPDIPLLPTAPGETPGGVHGEARGRARGRDVIALDGPPALAELLSDILPGLLPARWPVRHSALATLGVRRMELADVIDELAALDRSPAWWHGLYATLAGADPEALGALPVPLADGRLVRGPRGLLIAEDGLDPAGLAALELRFVDPRAAHPLLIRLGATPAGPRAVLDDPAVRAAVARSYDASGAYGASGAHDAYRSSGAHDAYRSSGAHDAYRSSGAHDAYRSSEAQDASSGAQDAYRSSGAHDVYRSSEAFEAPGPDGSVSGTDAEGPEAVAAAVLSLVAAARVDPGDRPWLAELALPAADGDRYPAGELLFPDAPLREVVAADAPFEVVDPSLVERYGAAPLEAVGVLRTFALVREQDVPLADIGLDLDGEEDWVADILADLPAQDLPPMVPELTAVRDLELVERWDRALELLARPPLRAALVEPTRLSLADGSGVPVLSYTAWWLRRHPVLGGQRPDGLRAPGAEPILAGLYDPAPAGLDPEVARALGVRTSLAEVLAEPDDLLARLADPARTVSRDQLRTIWAALAKAMRDAPAHEAPPDPPTRVRALVDDDIEIVPAADALVLDEPALLPLLTGQPLVIVPYELAADLAELLDLPLASEEIEARVESTGVRRTVPEVVHRFLPDAPAHYQAHDPLIVAGRPVPWWCEAEADTVHVGVGADAGQDGIFGLARGLAWVGGHWSDRLLVEAVLRSPDAIAALLAEADLDG